MNFSSWDIVNFLLLIILVFVFDVVFDVFVRGSLVGTAFGLKSQLQYWCGFDSIVWRIFLPESTFSADSLTVFLQPLYAITCICSGLHFLNPQHWQHYHCFDSEILDILIGMGSAALVAAVASFCSLCLLRSILFPCTSSKCLLMVMKWCLMSSDVSWHIRDKLRPMPKHGSV